MFTAEAIKISPTAEMEDYEDLYGFFNTSGYGEDTTIKAEFVMLCSKKQVNAFAAKFLPTIYYAIFLLSLIGNGLVLYIIHKYEKLNTVTNIFLQNLVISDLVFSASLPFWATYHASEWIFGRALCKLVGAMYFVGFYSSILFLTLMTFDRYLAVVHAVTSSRSRRNAYALASSIVVWCVSILATVKEFVLYNVQENHQIGVVCEETGFNYNILKRWQLVGNFQQFFIFFLLPVIVVLYCYVRITIRIMHTRMQEKCRAVKLIFIILIAFFICWTPYNVIVLLKAAEITRGSDHMSCDSKLDYALYISRNIAYLYCCINPIFYTFLGKKFQSHFRRLLATRIPCLKKHIVISQSSKTTSYRSPQTMYEY